MLFETNIAILLLTSVGISKNQSKSKGALWTQNLPQQCWLLFDKATGHIFIHVRPFYARAVCDLDP
jgi:hypothetical protein